MARAVRVRERGNRRVHLPGRGVLLPGDEHPAAGRAPRDGARHRASTSSSGSSGSPRASRSVSRSAMCMRNGHAIEVRINAEDPAGGRFVPSPGTITQVRRAGRPGRAARRRVRGGRHRQPVLRQPGRKARRLGARPREGRGGRMLRALAETEIAGVATTIPADVAILVAP